MLYFLRHEQSRQRYLCIDHACTRGLRGSNIVGDGNVIKKHE